VPIRVSVATFNVWGDTHLSTGREVSLERTLCRMSPDIILFQEATENNMAVARRALPRHDSLAGLHEGFSYLAGGNISWDARYLTAESNGFVPMLSREYPHRGLHWVRLRVNGSEVVLFVCTAHLPWCGTDSEIRTGINPRIAATQVITDSVEKLINTYDVFIFGGDLNEDFHPLRIFRSKLGAVDVFEQLDLSPPVTHPVRPSDADEEMRPNRTLDWILSRPGPGNCRPIAAFAKGIRGGTQPPSDHLPIITIFELS
ncbi:unnamed protein product, partial [Ectocarpus fasciculatus]